MNLNKVKKRVGGDSVDGGLNGYVQDKRWRLLESDHNNSICDDFAVY
jgi:hypothetical protein